MLAARYGAMTSGKRVTTSMVNILAHTPHPERMRGTLPALLLFEESLWRRHHQPSPSPIHLSDEFLPIRQQEFPLGSLHLDHDPGRELVHCGYESQGCLVLQADREAVQLVEIDLVVGKRAERFLRYPEEMGPERIEPIPVVHSDELDQPFAVVAPALLDRERPSHRLSPQVHDPDLAPRLEDRIRVVSQGKKSAVSLEAVRLSQPAHHYMPNMPSSVGHLDY